MNKVVLDTNILLNFLDTIDDYDEVIIPIAILEELDKQKMIAGELGFRARNAIRKIKQSRNIEFDYINQLHSELGIQGWLANSDNIIISSCLRFDAELVTCDVLMQVKAEMMGVRVIYKEKVDKVKDYTGWENVQLTNDELSEFYLNKNKNAFDLLIGQYVILYDMYDEPIDVYRWTGCTHEQIGKKVLQSIQLGKLVSKDFYQQCAIDSLTRNTITMIKGKAGTGKSLIALNYAMNMLEKRKYNKLIIFTNPTPTRGSVRLGFLPGDLHTKLLDSSIGSMLISKFGDRIAVEGMLEKGEIVLLPFSDIRGFDTTGMKAIVFITEAQNLSVDLMKLAIQRCGEDSKLIIDGDYTAQVDSVEYEGENNGMRRTSQIFRGESIYGEVELPNIYRSKIAQIAERM